MCVCVCFFFNLFFIYLFIFLYKCVEKLFDLRNVICARGGGSIDVENNMNCLFLSTRNINRRLMSWRVRKNY